MNRGYAGKFLDIDLSRDKIQDIKLPDVVLEQYFGGRGVGAKILWDRLGEKWRTVDPLGPENLLIALTGPMTGIYPGGRVCITGKSPVSNGTVGSTASTEFAHELRTAGYDGVIVSGRAEKPVYILVTDDGAEIRDASRLWGTMGEKTLKILNKEIPDELEGRDPRNGLWKEPGIVYIGPAGENMVRNACVMTKLCHACGYGGYGSVMGSKNLKAIVAKGRGPIPRVYAPEAVKLLWKRAHQHLIANDSFRRQGTGYGGWSTGNSYSSEPIRNWQDEWHDERSFGGPEFETEFWVKKSWSDFNCTTNCMKLSCVNAGPYKGAITDNPDYELQAYCGANFGIFDPAANIHLSALIDNLGHSGLGGANTMGFAAELYQRGILTEEDLGFKLEWGDVEAFDRLAHVIAYREGIGDVLAEGTYRAALKIGEMKGLDLIPYVVHVKGIEIGAHGTRSDEDFLAHDIGYAVNVQGGDHTSIVTDGFHEMSTSLFNDSAVICNFARSPLDLIFDFAKAVTGYDISIDIWRRMHGPRITTLQRALLLLGGPDVIWEPVKDDENPDRFYEPLPSGPHKGRTTDQALVKSRRTTYFETLGWDERGIPRKETLNKLGLSDLERSMAKLR
ncbi:MAG: aldehyde ferredoxin oxidoreductase C-terminal domain-containing protein [Candidatus Bathyarchaeota archaeon]